MTAKEYLNQGYRIDQRINSKMEQVASLRDLAFKASSTLTDMPSGSRDVHSKENIIVKMLDMEREINSDINKLLDLKHEIAKAIQCVKNSEHQTLLEKRYLCFMPWEQIAVDMGYSLRNIFVLHSAALKSITVPRTLH